GQSGGAQAAPPGAGSSAVLALVDQADRSARAGRLDSAADSLERALRIEPRNARLWHRLAALRLAEGNGAQAQALAAKSNSLAGDDLALQAANWNLIAEVRRRAGDADGARQAQARSEALQQR
ncbi:MAG: tetratricopeptide repeat protein, partial [Gammaproteobacteria bacterium]